MRASWPVLVVASFVLCAACGGDPPRDGGATVSDLGGDRGGDGGGADGADVVEKTDVPSADLLLCMAVCMRQERAMCVGFDAERCPARCAAQYALLPPRCREAVEAVLRCTASFANYTCDARGVPASTDCVAEEGVLRECALGVMDGGPGDAPPADVVDAADAPTVVDTPERDVTEPDAVEDAPREGGMDGSVVDAAPPEDVPGEVLVDDRVLPDRPRPDVPPSLVCPAPRATVTVPGMEFLREGTTLGMDDIPSTRCQPLAEGPEDAYALTVTSRTGVVIDTEGARTSFDTVLSVRRMCNDSMSEVSCDDDSGRDRTSSIRAVLDPGSYAILVDGFAGDSGPYALRVRSFTPRPNATCAGALALAPGATLAGQDGTGGGLRDASCRDTPGGPLFYSVTVPATSRVQVRATPVGGPAWTPVIALLGACGARTCTGGAQADAPGAAATVVLANSGTTPRTFLLSVASATTAEGSFDLAASAPAAVPRGTTCETAVALVSGTVVRGQNAATGFLSGAGLCRADAMGGQLFYSLRIGGRQRATIRATPTGAWSPVVRVRTFCGATSCLAASSGGGPGAPAVVAVDNRDTFALDVIISVAAAGAPGTFDLVATLGSIPPGAICEAPVALSATAPARANTLEGLRSGASLCAPTATGGQLFYTLRIPPGNSATVRAMPTGAPAWRPTVRALASCASTACLTFATADGVGAPATLVLDNPGTTPRDVVITVAGGGMPAGGGFDLTVSFAMVGPPPYTLAMIPVSCDALDRDPAVAPDKGWEDDSSTDLLAMPFSFGFFGATATYYSVSSNGFLQLWTGPVGDPDVASVNFGIPSASPPNAYVAPFWDDLVPVDEILTDVRVATLGRIPSRRLVIQWRNWEILGTARSRLTFQAKLFESSRVIEFHYCSMMPATATVLGASATIGVENFAGTEGLQVAFNRLNAVNPMTAFRLTPR